MADNMVAIKLLAQLIVTHKERRDTASKMHLRYTSGEHRNVGFEHTWYGKWSVEDKLVTELTDELIKLIATL